MPINTSKAKKTLDFEYEDNSGVYGVKYHYTDKFGPTISLYGQISEDRVTGEISFPANMFVEITDFLRDQNLVDERKVVKKAFVKLAEVPVGLPLPVISGETDKQVEDEFLAPSENEVQSFDPVKIEEQEVVKKEGSKKTEETIVSEEEAKVFLEEREKAREKAGTAQKKIKKLEPVPDPNHTGGKK
jgi:hypothetical protein